jgi:hypothetical protein
MSYACSVCERQIAAVEDHHPACPDYGVQVPCLCGQASDPGAEWCGECLRECEETEDRASEEAAASCCHNCGRALRDGEQETCCGCITLSEYLNRMDEGWL